ncbi:MAG: hypothetical protein WCQ90_11240 [Deltaproteobacteria bacterium]
MCIQFKAARVVTIGLLVVIYLALLIHAYAAAAPLTSGDTTIKGQASQEAADTAVIIVAEGKAGIPEGKDTEEARGAAIANAREKAILKAAGLYVHPDLVSKEKVYLLKVFKAKEGDIFGETKTLSENRDDGGALNVRMEFKINKGIVEEAISQNLFDDRIIVITEEKSNKKPTKKRILEQEIISKVKLKGYTVVGYRTMKNDTLTRLIASSGRGGAAAVKSLGMYLLANTIIMGSVEASFSEKTQEIYSAHAKGHARVYNIGSNKVNTITSGQNIKGFGSGEDKACLDALQKASTSLTEGTMKILSKKEVKSFTLIIRETGGYSSIGKIKGLLSAIPYLREIKAVKMDIISEKMVMRVKAGKDVDYLIREIAGLNSFVIENVKGSTIYLEARKLM